MSTNLESMKGPIVVIALLLIIGAVCVSGNASDTEKIVGLITTGLTVIGYISSHQAKSLMQMLISMQPTVSDTVTAAEDLTPEAHAIISGLQAGQMPTAKQIASLYPDVSCLIGDLQKLAPQVQVAVEATK